MLKSCFNTAHDPPGTPLLRLQELLATQPHAIVRRSLDLAGAVSGEYVKHYAAVTHRWETAEQPDPHGAQWRALKELLAQRPHIRCVSDAPQATCCAPSIGRNHRGLPGMQSLRGC